MRGLRVLRHVRVVAREAAEEKAEKAGELAACAGVERGGVRRAGQDVADGGGGGERELDEVIGEEVVRELLHAKGRCTTGRVSKEGRGHDLGSAAARW